jgi:hypothetical protein
MNSNSNSNSTPLLQGTLFTCTYYAAWFLEVKLEQNIIETSFLNDKRRDVYDTVIIR